MQQDYVPTKRSSYPASLQMNQGNASSPLFPNKGSYQQPYLNSPTQATFNRQYYQPDLYGSNTNNPLEMSIRNPRRSNMHSDSGRKATITHLDKNRLPSLNMMNDFGGNRGSKSYISPMNSYDGTSRRDQIPIRPYYGEDAFPMQNDFYSQSPLLRSGNRIMNSGNGYYNRNNYTEEPRSSFNSKTADVLMSSLQKQNLILAELTNNFSSNKDFKVLQEAKELENKIRLLEGSLPLRPNYPNQNQVNWNLLAGGGGGFNPFFQPNPSDFSSPLQLMQLHQMMNQFNLPSFGGLPNLPVMPNQFMLQQMNLYQLQERQRRKDRAHKKKLYKLLLSLQEKDKRDSEESEPEEQVKKPKKDKDVDEPKPPKRRSSKRKTTQKPTDEETAQSQAKLKVPKEDPKKKAKRKLMALMWVKLYPRIHYTEFYKAKTEAREKAYESINEQIGVSIVNTKDWACKSSVKAFDLIFGNSKVLTLVSFAGKKFSPKDIESRLGDIQKFFKALMDSLIANTKYDKLPPQLVSMLGNITQDYCYPPQHFLFGFELSRLNFTHTVALKDTKPPKVQMMCIMFVFVRVLIAELLLQPTNVLKSAKVTDNLMRNVKTLASILVITILEYLRSRVVIQNDNQNHLDSEIKLKQRSQPIPFNPPMDLKDEPDEEENISKKKKDATEILIANLYTKEQLAPFFQKKALVDELKALIEGWCTEIANVVIEAHAKEVQEKKNSK